MNARTKDITQTLISSNFIYSNLSLLFPDSVLLDSNFKIVGISVEVQQSLGYSAEQMKGKSISSLEGSGTLEHIIRQRIAGGFFADMEVNLKKKFGGVLRYSISGFYLGLISDMDGTILLKLSNQQEVSLLDQQLRLSKAQLDNFIYRAAHDIRGPLATIQGLTNLIKMRKDDSELDKFIQLIDSHSKILDDRLRKLLFLANVDQGESAPEDECNLCDLEMHLRKVIEDNSRDDVPELNLISQSCIVKGISEELVKKMLANFMLHILGMPKSADESKSAISVDCKLESFLLIISIKVQGIVPDLSVYSDIIKGDIPIYTDLMKHTQLTNIYAAQKIASKLKASLHISAQQPGQHCVTISLPLLIDTTA